MSSEGPTSWRSFASWAVLAGALAGATDGLHTAVGMHLGLGGPGIVALCAIGAGTGGVLALMVAGALAFVPRVRGGAAWTSVWVGMTSVLVARVALSVWALHGVQWGWSSAVVLAALAVVVWWALSARAAGGSGLVVALAVGLLGWGVASRTSVETGPRVTLKHPHVLLITVASLRADRVGAYPIDTAAFDRLAAEGTTFDVVVAPGAGRDAGLDALLGEGVEIGQGGALAEAMASQGYATGAFLGAPVDPRLRRGFQVYDDTTDWPVGISRTLPGWLARVAGLRPRPERRAADVVARAQRFLAGRQGAWFIWVHLEDPAPPFEAPVPFDARYAPSAGAVTGRASPLSERGTLDPRHGGRWDAARDPAPIVAAYDGEVAYVDHAVAGLLGSLQDAGLGDSTLVMMAGAEGMTLDAGDVWFGTSRRLLPSMIRVPAALRLPGKVPVGQVWRSPVALSDVGSVLRAYAGLSSEPGGVFWEEALRRDEGPSAAIPVSTTRGVGAWVPGGWFVWDRDDGYRAWPTTAPSDVGWTRARLDAALASLPPHDHRPPVGDAERDKLMRDLIGDVIDPWQAAPAP